MENTDYICIDSNQGFVKNIGITTNIPYTVYKDRCEGDNGTVVRLKDWINPKYTMCTNKFGKKYFTQSDCDNSALTASEETKYCKPMNGCDDKPINLWYNDFYKKLMYVIIFWLIVILILYMIYIFGIFQIGNYVYPS